jgi:hypothetical protein
VQLLVTPLAFHPAEDEKYRHLWVDHGQLRWQALPAASHRTTVGGTQAGSPAALQLVDRHGTALWHDGASTAKQRRQVWHLCWAWRTSTAAAWPACWRVCPACRSKPG